MLGAPKTNAPEGAFAPLVLPRVSTLLLHIEHACSFTSTPGKPGAAAGISTCCRVQVSMLTMAQSMMTCIHSNDLSTFRLITSVLF
jgi:hypothetical protein